MKFLQGLKIKQTLLAVMAMLTVQSAMAEKSADEIAKELANPNTPLASLTTKLQFRAFEGDLPRASSQDSTSLLFQPSFPFALSNGDLLFVRPAVPIFFDQPAFNATTQSFENEAGMGDIAMDIGYGRTSKSGLLTLAGMIVSLPTATDDRLGSDKFTMGPEFLIGKLTKKSVLALFPNHQWDIGGSGPNNISLSTIQVIGTLLPGGGWNYGTAPIMTYDHINNDWTIPLNFTFGKTIIRQGRPWKLSMEINYFVDQPDAFGPEWLIGFNVAPVIKNPFVR